MRSAKSSISKATSYQEIGEYWDNHDLGEVWHKTKEAHFNVRIKSEVSYCALEKSLSDKIRSAAKRQGLSSDALVNLWLYQKLQELNPH